MANTYYISPTGNDTTGDGSSGNPWLTLSKFNTSSAAGDTCSCATGTYREAGTTLSKNNLTIQAAGGATPVFVGTQAYTSWSKTGGQTNVYEAAYTPANAYAAWNGATRLTKKTSIAEVDALTNSWYVDTAGDKLYVNIGGGAPTSIEAISTNVYALILTGTGITVNGLAFQWQMQAVDLRAGSNTLQNCTFNQWAGYLNNGAFGFVQLTGSGNTIDGCSGVGIARTATAINILEAASNTTVQNCTFSYGYNGIIVNGGTGHVIQDNTISMYGEDGIPIWGTVTNPGGATVRRNKVYDCGHAMIWAGGSGAGVVTVTMDHNLSYLTHDIHLDADIQPINENTYCFVADPGASINWYNNVAANTKLNTGTGARMGFLVQSNGTINAENNIIYNDVIGCSVNNLYTPTLAADYNDFNGNTTNYNLPAKWGAGAHDITGDPKLVDPSTTFDFHLLSSSPCINAGVAVAGINDSDVGGHDIGRYDYVPPLAGHNIGAGVWQGVGAGVC